MTILTVGALIERLQQFPDATPVKIECQRWLSEDEEDVIDTCFAGDIEFDGAHIFIASED